MTQESELAATQAADDFHHCQPSLWERSVKKWLPSAFVNQGDETFKVWHFNSEGQEDVDFPSASTVEGAWQQAFTAMQQVNAYYLWENSGRPEGQAFGEWIDSMWNIENGPVSPNPPSPPVE